MAVRSDVAASSIPHLPTGVELRFDDATESWTISVPARVLVPDDVAVELLKRCDGQTPVSTIVDELSQTFSASPDQVAEDVKTMLVELADKGMIEL